MKSILIFLFLISCTKQEVTPAPAPASCTFVAIYSDKYTSDTTYLLTDTLYTDCLSGRWLDTFKMKRTEGWRLPKCQPYFFQLEYYRYEIWPEKTRPYRKK